MPRRQRSPANRILGSAYPYRCRMFGRRRRHHRSGGIGSWHRLSHSSGTLFDSRSEILDTHAPPRDTDPCNLRSSTEYPTPLSPATTRPQASAARPCLWLTAYEEPPREQPNSPLFAESPAGPPSSELPLSNLRVPHPRPCKLYSHQPPTTQPAILPLPHLCKLSTTALPLRFQCSPNTPQHPTFPTFLTFTSGAIELHCGC